MQLFDIARKAPMEKCALNILIHHIVLRCSSTFCRQFRMLSLFHFVYSFNWENATFFLAKRIEHASVRDFCNYFHQGATSSHHKSMGILVPKKKISSFNSFTIYFSGLSRVQKKNTSRRWHNWNDCFFWRDFWQLCLSNERKSE